MIRFSERDGEIVFTVRVVSPASRSSVAGEHDGSLRVTTYVQKIFSITPKDIQRIAQTYLLGDKMTLVVVGDKSKVSDQVSTFGQVN